MGRVTEAFLPTRLGRSFRWLLASSWTSNLGDGLALAAGPLLVARLTDSAFVVALAATVQWLPPLLFALPAGVLTDRLDRRKLVVGVSLVRVLVLGLLVAAVATGAVPVGVVLAALFASAVAEVFTDNAAVTLLPALVDRDDLAVGNARLQTGLITLNQLAGPPVGAALFVVGAAWPFAAQAVLLLGAVGLVARIVLPPREVRERVGVRHELLEGLRWTWRHASVRTLVVTIFAFNLTFGAAWSVLVLYATERLGLGPIGYGLVTTVIAAGGIVGTLLYGRITRVLSLGAIMRIGLVVETLTHLSLALTTTPWVAMVVFAAFGAHGFIWLTTSITIRQRAVPHPLQGRVNALNSVGTYGGLVIGSTMGGALAASFGVVAPFWFAFVGSALLVVLLWRQLAHVAHDDAGGLAPVG